MSVQRRQFLQLTAASGLLGSGILGAEAAAADADEPQASPPVAMAPRADGMEIIWRVPGLAKGVVEYGPTPELGQVANADGWGLRPAGDEVLRVRIDGLKAGTTYYYRAVTEAFDRHSSRIAVSQTRQFRTLDPRAPKSTFCVWNDTHQNAGTLKKLAEITPAADFLLWNGDICNDWHQDGEVAETLLSPGDGIDHSADHPLVLLRGNHDLRGRFAHQLERHAAMPAGQPWFAFRSGPIAVIGLDTGEDKPDEHPNLMGRAACEPMRQAQAAWLREVTARPEIARAPYRIVFCHIPLRWTDEETNFGYDYYSRRSRDLWHDPLVQWGAQLIVSGHIHKDGHLPATDAFPYQQLIGGGPKPAQARLIKGTADAGHLEIQLTDLEGNVIRKLSLPALPVS